MLHFDIENSILTNIEDQKHLIQYFHKPTSKNCFLNEFYIDAEINHP